MRGHSKDLLVQVLTEVPVGKDGDELRPCVPWWKVDDDALRLPACDALESLRHGFVDTLCARRAGNGRGPVADRRSRGAAERLRGHWRGSRWSWRTRPAFLGRAVRRAQGGWDFPAKRPKA